jgi:hypothetical protein
MNCASSSAVSEYHIETTDGYASAALVTSLPNVIALAGFMTEKERAKRRFPRGIVFPNEQPVFNVGFD